MGQFLNQLRTAVEENHKKVGNLPFLKRYETSDIKLTDHYLHLRQLLPVYDALEKILKTPTCTLTLTDDKVFLLNRSEQLRKDIEFLEPHVPAYVKNWVSPRTNDYVDYLNDGLDDRVVFGHFLARILGDLFGGQRIKARMQKFYTGWQLSQPDSTEGLSFYQFPDGTLRDLLKGLEAMSQEMGDESQAIMMNAASDGIARHMPIFDDLEIKRAEVQKYKQSVQMFKGGAVMLASAAVAYTASRFLG